MKKIRSVVRLALALLRLKVVVIRRRSTPIRAELTFYYRASDPASLRTRDAIHRVLNRDLEGVGAQLVEVEASQGPPIREVGAPLGYPWLRIVHESGVTVWRFGEVTAEELERLLLVGRESRIPHPINKL